ncbi:hypothetical protein ACVI55_004836 [Sinorhizobium medicae]
MAVRNDAAVDRPGSAHPDRNTATANGDAKSKGVAILEGLLGRESAPVIPLRERHDRILPDNKPDVRPKWLKKLSFRHTVIAASFLGLVALPATLASLYMAFIAADQYHSTASFAVRSIEGGVSQ